MAQFSCIPILILVAFRSALAVPLVARQGQFNMNTTFSNLGGTFNATGQPINQVQPFTPNTQPQIGSGLSTNQDGQLVNQNGEIITVNPNGQLVNQNGDIVDQNSQPISQTGSGDGGFGNGGMFGNDGGQGGVVNNVGQCNPSVPEAENDYGTNGDCGTVRDPNQPYNGAQPGDPWNEKPNGVPQKENDLGTTGGGTVRYPGNPDEFSDDVINTNNLGDIQFENDPFFPSR
ncbi:hypothetical protein PCANC_13638 [Puccinia coronata f. sp. avenae]|uniref:Uncharacterized protein n=1 Tax=Puccinia coronata f. sp. avenae TaxID=200324 RepID=A0A2N5VLT4_9BASI|nr:hypothetical protein PCASD_17288 [Puccinia coronata f. sp. avenae]PLW38215.1 hypothetical protein PCANC_13638 [Puccinia coronata f. sp. avenae]PLW50959.1 hypothetical protein PCASD_01218 [Puccinia coronata f. sp. avenae]